MDRYEDVPKSEVGSILKGRVYTSQGRDLSCYIDIERQESGTYLCKLLSKRTSALLLESRPLREYEVFTWILQNRDLKTDEENIGAY